MRYISPQKSLFIRNRIAFMKRMRPGSIAIFHANDLYTSNGDATYRFTQDSNLYYLTGIDQEEVILVLFPDAPKKEYQEMLFIRKSDEHTQIWEGWKYSKDEAREVSGIESIFYYPAFEGTIRRLLYHFDSIYLDINEQGNNRPLTRSAAHRLAEMFKHDLPTHQLLRASNILADLRSIKSSEEIHQLRKAIDITGKAFDRVLRCIRPGMYEYEIEAEILYEFYRNGAQGPAFDTIVAGGKRACTLHYVHNDHQLAKGSLVLLDFGAKYGNYCADMSRTIPINGRFNKRQRELYQAVLDILLYARSLLTVGNDFDSYNTDVGNFVTEKLLMLDLLQAKEVAKKDTEKPTAYKKYLMHGVSHFLGLDTHDEGNRYTAFQEGMVLTCEPGIYIPEEGIGIRLENDILITEEGPVDLMEGIPLYPEEIENAMEGLHA